MAKKAPTGCTWYRGTHALPWHAQDDARPNTPGVRYPERDFLAKEILRRFRGKTAHGFVLTDEQAADKTKSWAIGNYRYLVRAPGEPSTAWTAFRTKPELRAFLKGYGLKLAGKLTPGSDFRVKVPRAPKMRKLVCR